MARNLIRDIGYTHPKYGFDYETCAIVNTIHSQSPDIAQGVNLGGAGDQGIMFGYACTETEEFMPLPIILAHKLVRRMADVRRSNVLRYLGPDCKSQVTVEYDNCKPKRVDAVVLACQHTSKILDKTGKHISAKARQELIDVIAKPVLKHMIDKDTKYYVNQTGKFVVGGPQSDTGMTGRKIIVDTYGGTVPHGGGAFSGKDPTKVDRSAAYMCRYIAKNIVAAGLAERFLVQLSYVIGYAEPLSIFVDTYGTGKLADERFIKLIRANFELTPRGIIKSLQLLRPIYRKTACYGHFGRTEPEFIWEETDKAAALKKQAARL
jgi:S-adenosylmethionine synthetase